MIMIYSKLVQSRRLAENRVVAWAGVGSIVEPL
jgi:hypothetical protein